MHPSPAAPAAYEPALGRVRAFVVFLVVVHHAVLAYYPGVSVSERFVGGAMTWLAFPVLDPARWALAPVVAFFNDTFFMALLFLLSGLFVSGSVARKGPGRFVRDRLLRLGIPFLFSAGLVTPAAYYAAYLQTGGEPGLASYARAWSALGAWPTGPAWFVLQLLVYDLVVALLFALAPGWTGRLARLAAGARERPARFFAGLALLSFAAYAPLALAFGWDDWTWWGPLQFQTSRILHYFVYFAAGIAIGAAGIGRSLVAADGALARRWWLWTLVMLGAFLFGLGVVSAAVEARGEGGALLAVLGPVAFALSCAASCFGMLALFTRFGQRPSAAWREAADASYGIYLVHYAFVAWCQFALLGADLPAPAKAAVVIVVAYLASAGVASLLRRTPLVARVL